MHESAKAFFTYLTQQGRLETLHGYSIAIKKYVAWLAEGGRDPLTATTDDVLGFQRWLAEDYLTPAGMPLAKSTQVTRIAAVKSFHRWMARRGMVVSDVTRKVKLPKVVKSATKKDFLSLQEATAMLQTKASLIVKAKPGSWAWLHDHRDLALLALAIATGRRRCGLLNLVVLNLDFKRNELRYEREKGKFGRVVPVAGWAMAAAKEYVTKARPKLRMAAGNDHLFVGDRVPTMNGNTMTRIIAKAQRETVDANPDLEDLPEKHLTPHSLRVSFAKLLFTGGCNIRSINELMNHDKLSTTARYTPLAVEDMRRVCRRAHPRA